MNKIDPNLFRNIPVGKHNCRLEYTSSQYLACYSISGNQALVDFIQKLGSFLNRIRAPDKEFKVRSNIVLKQPDYFNRHRGRDFLVLGSGPSLEKYNSELRTLIKDQNLITIAASGVMPLGEPDYMGFVNRYRFLQYGKSVERTRTKSLISIFFSDSLIKKHFQEEYEYVMWKKIDISTQGKMEPNGVFLNNGPAGVWLIWIAYAMGARSVYVTGIDGWTNLLEKNKETSYSKDRYSSYKPSIDKEAVVRKQHYWNDIQGASLSQVRNWTLKANRHPFQIITPTAYGDFYDPTVLRL